MAVLSCLAPAKVNLTLRVCGRRPDGLHVLDSLVAFADVGDRLTLEAAAETSLEVAPPDAVSGDNLVMRALDALEKHVGRALPARIGLEKVLPVAAGLGGGSSDAAACLRGLNALHALGLTNAELMEVGAPLGADVPVCVLAAPARLGEDVMPLGDFPECDVVLVNPRVPLATRDVFKTWDGRETAPEAPPPFTDFAALCAHLEARGNDLTAAAVSHVPAIRECVAALTEAGASYAAMSGSGASCFGLVPSGSGAGLAADYRARRPDDWCEAGRLMRAADTEINQIDE